MLGSPKRIDTRVTPEALQVIYMDEIAGRLADLAELYESLLKTTETEVERLAEVRSKLEEVKETLERTIPLGDTGDYKLSVTRYDHTGPSPQAGFFLHLVQRRPGGCLRRNEPRQCPQQCADKVRGAVLAQRKGEGDLEDKLEM